MRTIVHLSDLHFGRIDRSLVEPLIGAIREIAPDLVVISGDLTQRARHVEFREARAFLDALPGRVLAVPGNHDVPLWNAWNRFRRPLRRWRRHVGRDPEPFFFDGAVAVCGVNTARSLAFAGGRINARQIAHLETVLATVPRTAAKIVVSHHSLDLPSRFSAKGLAGRARQAANVLSRCGVDLLLAGHLHTSLGDASDAVPYRIGGHAAVVVQAGTALSTRLRGEANSFNVIRVEASRITIERCLWSAGAGVFASGSPTVFPRSRPSSPPFRP